MWRGREARTGRGGDKQREGEKARWKGQGREEGGAEGGHSESPVRVSVPSLSSESPSRVSPPSLLSESPFRVSRPSLRPESPFRVSFPSLPSESRRDRGGMCCRRKVWRGGQWGRFKGGAPGEEGGGSVVRHTKSRRMPALLLAGEFLRRVCPRARGFLRRVWRARGGGGGGVGDRERHFEVLALELAERLLHDA